MNSNRLRLFLISVSLLIAPLAAKAQNPQSPTDAQRMLENNPALLQQLRARILSSGLTPDQIRARLRAEGYPESLLDAYLPGGAGSGAEVVNPGTPDDVLNAISQLGIVDTTDADGREPSETSEPREFGCTDRIAGHSMTRAPRSAAVAWERSVLPPSLTITSAAP